MDWSTGRAMELNSTCPGTGLTDSDTLPPAGTGPKGRVPPPEGHDRAKVKEGERRGPLPWDTVWLECSRKLT